MDNLNFKIFSDDLTDSLEKILQRIFDIREGEGLRVTLMWLYIFLIISTLLIVKPVVNALFLSKFGADQLSTVFILIAVFAAPVSSLYLNLLKKIPLNQLIVKTLQIVVGSLMLFWILLTLNFLESWVLYIFYVWVAIFAVISSSQFWILANVLFNAREAKRLFGFIGAGAIAGGIFGGYLTNFLAPVLGSENLIFICIAFLAICIKIMQFLWSENSKENHDFKFQQQKQFHKLTDHPMVLIRHSRHLLYLASLVGISVLVGRLVEYQFSAIASDKIVDPDNLTAFFGFWLSNLNIASLLIQLFLTRRVVGVFGVGTSLFFLPVGILLGALSVLIYPGLASAILIKVSDGSLKNSINKAGMELLALPIPLEIKNQTKSFIDIFVDSFASGISGFLLVLLTFGLNFSIRNISLIIILLLGVWIYIVLRIRQEYINSFRLKIETPKSEIQASTLNLEKESIIGGLLNIMDGTNEKQILEVLQMVKSIQNDRLLPGFQKLLNHPSEQIQLEVLRNIYAYNQADFTNEVKKFILSPNFEISTETLHYLFQHTSGNRIKLLREYLNHEKYTIRGAALLCAARESRKNIRLQKVFKLKETVESGIKSLAALNQPEEIIFTKKVLARVIGTANIPELFPFLHIFFNDPSCKVVETAIESAGFSQQPEFIPILIRMLRRPELWKSIHDALLYFGSEIFELLSQYLGNPFVDKNIRISIPKLLAATGTQKAVDILIQNLNQKDLTVRDEIISRLYQIRLNQATLNFNENLIVNRILDEAHNYLNTLTFLYTQIKAKRKFTPKETDLIDMEKVKLVRIQLIQNLEKRLDNNLNRIFRLLGLKYPPEDIEQAYIGIKSTKSDLRINAIEFLDNLLEMSLKKIIIPIAESALFESMIDQIIDRFGFKLKNEFECLIMLLASDDPLLQITTLRLITELKDDRYLSFIGGLMNNEDEQVSESARIALKAIGIVT